MSNDHFDSLKQLRDRLVVERRHLVNELASDSYSDVETRRESIGEFIGLQQFIDTVERAIAHEVSLTQNRMPPRGGSKHGGPPRPGFS